jgi:hypothetical protein
MATKACQGTVDHKVHIRNLGQGPATAKVTTIPAAAAMVVRIRIPGTSASCPAQGRSAVESKPAEPEDENPQDSRWNVGSVDFPDSAIFFEAYPLRGPMMIRAARAIQPPKLCTTVDPAKSTKRFSSQPLLFSIRGASRWLLGFRELNP